MENNIATMMNTILGKIKPNFKYTAIIKLYIYCVSIGVYCYLEPCFDGWVLRFKSGDDFAQHRFSYGNDKNKVEPAIGCKVDYTAVTLKNAKRLVKKYKEKLNNYMKYNRIINPEVCYECPLFNQKRHELMEEDDSIFDVYKDLKVWVEENCQNCEKLQK